MVRLLLEYFARALPVAVPLLIPKHLPPFSWARGVLAHLGFTSVTDAQLGSASALFGLLVVFAFDAANLYLPKQNMRRFGAEFFQRVVTEIEKTHALKFGEDLRLNVVLLRSPRWLGRFHPLPLRWVANSGFKPAGRSASDSHLRIWAFQGLFGERLKTGEVRFRSFRDEPVADSGTSLSVRWKKNDYMWRWRFRRTTHIKAILTVPLIFGEADAANPKFRISGFITLDAVSEAGASWLASRKEKTAEYLRDNGLFLELLD